MKKRIKQWLPLVFWVVLIFGLSSVPRLSSDYPALPTGFDKCAHFFEYTVLAMLFYRGLRYTNQRVWWLLSLSVVLVGVSVAALDELYQSFIPGRDSSIIDLAADGAGVVAGTCVAVFRYGRRIKGTEE
ncbi:MAG: VanZ family protein [bacterium]|nr:MAG: VanZ family protein [bacterium]